MIRCNLKPNLLIILMLLSVFTAKAANSENIKQPDFAFPVTVIENADKALRNALKTGDDIELVTAVLQIATAQSTIDSDSLFSMPTMIDGYIGQAKSPAAKALLTLIEALTVKQIYENNRYRYNRVEQPLEPWPESLDQWSGQQFRTRINELLGQAYELSKSDPQDIARWGRIIEADQLSIRYFPTVRDFVALMVTDNLEREIDFDLSETTKKIQQSEITFFDPGSAPWCEWTCRLNASRDSSFFLDLYNQYIDCEAARLFLQRYLEKLDDKERIPDAVRMIRQSLSHFPAYWDNTSLQNQLNSYLQPWIQVSATSITSPGTSLPVEIRYRNISGPAGVIVYRGPSNGTYTPDMSKAKLTEITRLKVNALDSLPYYNKVTLSFTPTEEAYYVLKPFIDNEVSSKYESITVLSSSLTPIVISNLDTNAVFVASTSDGRPVENVDVFMGQTSPKNMDNTLVRVGTTDDEGTLKFATPTTISPKSNSSKYVQLRRNKTDFVFNHDINVYSSRLSEEENANTSSVVFTDRGLYHPGDTISWSAIIYRAGYSEVNRNICTGHPVKVYFTNANHQIISSLTTTTDMFGRINGFFITPLDELTGNFRIKIFDEEKSLGTRDVMVSDFKLPTFSIELNSVERNVPHNGWVTVSGRATTFTGMPVANAQVTLRLISAHRGDRWFYPNDDDELGVLYDTSDSKGRFTIEIPSELLAGPDNDFFAKVAVTSTSGETQQSERPFTTGKPLTILYTGNINIDTKQPFALPVSIYNASGRKIKTPLKWWIEDCGDTLAEGIIESENDYVDLRKLLSDDIPSDEYELFVTTADSSLADTLTTDVVLYNSRKGYMPDDSEIFIPDKVLNIKNGSSGELLFGVPDDCYMFVTLSTGTQLVSVEGLETKAGFHRMKVALPEGHEKGQLNMFVVKNGDVSHETVNVFQPIDRTLGITFESFRDHMAPGDCEQWKLRLTAPGSDTGTQAAMIMTAYNKALENIKTASWPTKFHFPFFWERIGSDYLSSWHKQAQLSKRITQLQSPLTLQNPDFRYSPWSYPSFIIYGSQARGINNYSARKVHKDAEATALDELAVMAYNPSSKSIETEEEEEEEEEEGEEEYEVGVNDVDNEIPDSDSYENIDSFQYRDGEVLQAFWYPTLTTDSDGTVEMSVTLPYAIGTWSLKGFAWDKILNSGYTEREFITAKAVMVQPNLPRFLRAGDSGTLLANVFNNSGTGGLISTVIEIVNPDNGDIISTNSSSDYIEADASAVVTVDVKAPDNVSYIIYRIRSTLGNHTDGEQSSIAILQASAQVMDSQIFMLHPGESEKTIDLNTGDDMQLILQYCSNPAWDVIKALPSLYQATATTSSQSVRQLFRAAAASGIINSDKILNSLIKSVFASPSDSSLVSQLSKNDELKQATLTQTPWVRAAASQTQRMASLALLFDDKAVSTDINNAIELLSKLQNDDGGWRWGDWSQQSSQWATVDVLNALGCLNVLGYLPADQRLQTMIKKGLDYVQSCIKPKQGTDHNFTLLCTYFPDFKPSMQGRKILDATVQQLIGNWKQQDVWTKATSAMIAQHFGYKNVATDIISSIDQFAVTDRNGTVSFPSVKAADAYAGILFAYSTLTPGSPLIDGMRQWLVMRSQFNDDLAACDPTMIIAAFIKSGSRWTVPASEPIFKLDDSPINVEAGEIMTGLITTSLNAAGSNTVTITRTDNTTPSWGALLTRYTTLIDKIGAKTCSELAVEKELAVLRNGKWIYADDVKLGEQVRVLITLTAKADLSYVTLIDDRAAGFEPVNQIPGYDNSAGVSFYRESGNNATRFFIDFLPKGTYRLSYMVTANMTGNFISGTATAQSQYAPAIVAHSSGRRLTITAYPNLDK